VLSPAAQQRRRIIAATLSARNTMISLQRTVPALLAGAVGAAARTAFPAAAAALPPSVCGVTQSKKGLPGDYQTSAAMALARAAKRGAEPVAQELCAAVAAEAAAAGCPVSAAPSKNGFVNLTLDDGWLAAQVAHVAAGGLAPPPPQPPAARRRVLVDYASPNMGKELHPGHLRSAVIGDSLARALEASGWDVDRVSHVGDAGLPVAIVLAWYLQQPELRRAALEVLCSGGDDDAAAAVAPPAWTLPTSSLAAIRGGALPLPSPRELSQAYERGKRLMTMAATAAKAEGAAAAVAAAAATDSPPSDDFGPAAATAPHKPAPPQSPPPAAHLQTARAFAALVQSTLRQLQSVLGRMAEWEQQQATAAAAPTAAAGTPAATAAAATIPPLYTAWVAVCEASRRGYLPLFASLGVATVERGESTYVADLPRLVETLLAAGAAEVSHDAVVLFVDGRDAPPLLVRKGDGGFLYATIDLAALRRRLAAGYDRLVYVTDAAQAHHFRQLFAAARALGWVSPSGGNALHPTAPGTPVCLEHASFGVVQGPTGRKLSSRDGAEATLAGLLEDARAAAVRAAGEREAERTRERARLRALPGWSEGNDDGGGEAPAPVTAAAAAAAAAPPPPPPLSPRLAAAIAHSAVRYHDLCHAAASNYRLSFDAALALRGNTAPYLMYALTRLAAIRRQAARALETAGVALPPGSIAGAGGGAGAPVAGSAAAVGGADGANDDAGELASGGPAWHQLTAAVEALLLPQAQHHHQQQSDASPPAPRLHAAERALAVSVLRLPEAMAGCLSALSPHVLAEHMFTLASDFHSFYEACRVLQLPPAAASAAVPPTTATSIPTASDDANAQLRQSLLRLRLCAATDAALRLGCHVLGVRLIQRM
jgi:arginyl-tRNA synthetase